MCSRLRVLVCFLVVVDCSLFIVGRWLLFVGSCYSLLFVVVRCLLFDVICSCVLSLLVVVVICSLVSVVV